MNTMLSGALGLISGPLKNILDQLGGAKNELWLEIYQLMSRMSPENILAALKGAAIKLTKKMSVGGYTLHELLENFKIATYKVGDEEKVEFQASEFARDIASKEECTFPTEVEEGVEFVVGSLGDLFRFKNRTEAQAFLSEAFLKKRGLELCKPSDALYLRLAYTDQPSDEKLHVAMKPILGFDGIPRVFSLVHDSHVMQLYAYNADSDDKWNLDSLWIFRRKIAKS